MHITNTTRHRSAIQRLQLAFLVTLMVHPWSNIHAQPKSWLVSLGVEVPKLVGDMSSDAWGIWGGRIGAKFHPGAKTKTSEHPEFRQPIIGLLGFEGTLEVFSAYYRITDVTQDIARAAGLSDESRTTIIQTSASMTISPWPMIYTEDDYLNCNIFVPYARVGIGHSWYSPHSVQQRKYHNGSWPASFFLQGGLGMHLLLSRRNTLFFEGQMSYYFADDIDAVVRPESRNDAMLTLTIGATFDLGR